MSATSTSKDSCTNPSIWIVIWYLPLASFSSYRPFAFVRSDNTWSFAFSLCFLSALFLLSTSVALTFASATPSPVTAFTTVPCTFCTLISSLFSSSRASSSFFVALFSVVPLPSMYFTSINCSFPVLDAFLIPRLM